VSRGKPVNRFLWLTEPLADNPTFVDRPMFGGRAIYFDGRMVLYLAPKREPWRGVLVTCERDHHASILAQFPALKPHKILPKWLYLPESADTFERDAQSIVQCIKRLDPRFGIVPPAKKRKRAVKGKR
jgi:hypothetical protein